jgi:hypothetical protein
MISMEDRVWLMNAICELNHALLAPKFVTSKENIDKLIALRQQVGKEELNQVVDQLKKGLGI